MTHDLFHSCRKFALPGGGEGVYYSLPQLEREGAGPVSKLPVCIRIVLESVLRNYDSKRITEKEVRALANWQAKGERTEEIPFVVSRILLQDFTGVPLLVDLAAMRNAVSRLGCDAKIIEPLVPVDLVIDHSVQVDYSGTPDALRLNMEKEFERNHRRYQFLKWGTQAFESFRVVPPGIGICHQVNLEYLGKVVLERNGVYCPDTLVGTDSHTTMINGLGIVGWGVGGIEAEAGMLGQPIYFLTPDVVGVHLKGQLREGVNATDAVLRVTEILRKAKVVGKFVEYFGEGAANLSATDRATIANMAPEYGATMGFFPVDEETCAYLKSTGRSDEHVEMVRRYFAEQGMFGMPRPGQCEYSAVLELDLGTVESSVAGPKRPQDRIHLSELKDSFRKLLVKPVAENGYNKPASEVMQRFAVNGGKAGGHRDIGDGDVLIAAITSCTNTSNPRAMIAAGLVAKKAVQKGLRVPATVKTSLSPGSRVVAEYLEKSGLQLYLNDLGFALTGFGCMTCIGNSGPLDAAIDEAVHQHNVIGTSVLSGNRNFEARIHQSVKANFLASPPLVVAFALAGTVDIDMSREPLGKDKGGAGVYLRDIWPSMTEIRDVLRSSQDPGTYRALYGDFAGRNPLWNEIPAAAGKLNEWDAESTYIQEPPYFEDFAVKAPAGVHEIRSARALAIFGDSITTDHISPAGGIKPSSPAGQYLISNGVEPKEFNTYGARRGNDRVMVRGTFANVRIRNLLVPGVEGGVTRYQPGGEQMSIYDAAVRYRDAGVPLVIFAGQEYGTGSSRDWAAKGTMLLGVRVVVAQSFERIHRSNLVGMGVLPCQFKDDMNARKLRLDGTEMFDIAGLEELTARGDVTLTVRRADGRTEDVPLRVRIDTPIELEYYRNGGILPYVLRQLLSQ